MRLSQRVRVRVSGSGNEEALLETVRGSFRSRLVSRLLGNRYGVVVLIPRGKNVESVEIVESAKPPPG